MMVRQNDSNGQLQNHWDARSAIKRDELSRSIEETLADSASLQEPFSDEEDEVIQDSNKSIIIPPKLSLQSKSMPVVRVEPTEVPAVLPKPETDAISVPPATQKKRRLAGRSTKVQLQAVPGSDKKSPEMEAIDLGINPVGSGSAGQLNGKKSPKRQSSSDRASVSKRRVDGVITRSLAGFGLIRQGQRDVMVMNDHITPSSVVIVNLVEDPGPVVVKHITLHPQTGFTLHFSDSAELEARFNYVILMGELF
jgi:hypothetical protein